MSIQATADHPSVGALDAPAHVAAVALRVRDLDRMVAFYRDVIGLRVREADATGATLGTRARPLVRLLADPDARPEPRRGAGLFHTAFLLPHAADLGDWLRHALSQRVPLQGASDHTVSEAVYLDDPEGNGIEVYTDRAPRDWRWTREGVDMDTQPMNVDGVLGQARPGGWQGMPDEGSIGHVHLKVGNLETAAQFYTAVLGMDITHARGGARFVSWGGYHHHLGLNTWASAGAGPRTPGMTGLEEVRFTVSDDALWAALPERLQAGGVAADTPTDGTLRIVDPYGVSLVLTR